MRIAKQSVYLQIVEDVKRKVELGLLRAGEKLPSCRELAMKGGINPNTVQRAYTVLEESGIIYTVPKKGVYVADGAKPDGNASARKKLAELKATGLTKKQLLEMIDELYGENDDLY